MLDIVGWQGIPEKWTDHPTHAHNRLITSVVLSNEERRAVARAHSEQLGSAKGPVAFILADRGYGEWDREGADLHDKSGLEAFQSELRATLPENVVKHEIDAHRNDAAFADKALLIFDNWRAEGVVQG